MARNPSQGNSILTLKELRPGQSAEVVNVASADSDRLLRLASLGLLPGTRIRLQQRRPAYVLWVGETLLSLDQEIAQEIELKVI